MFFFRVDFRVVYQVLHKIFVIQMLTKISGGLRGESSNHFDDLFKELDDWEAILSSLPNFGVDQNQEECELPAPLVDWRS